jgi:hypothetical protein
VGKDLPKAGEVDSEGGERARRQYQTPSPTLPQRGREIGPILPQREMGRTLAQGVTET